MDASSEALSRNGPIAAPRNSVKHSERVFFAGIAVALLAVLSGCGSDGPATQQRNSADVKDTVLAFYKLALEDMKPREAFTLYAAADFVEHAPGVDGTAGGTLGFLEAMIAQSPQSRWEIVRSAAEDDLVFLHVRYTPAPGAPEIALAEIFRVEDNKLAEHWDVLGFPPETVINPNPRF
jgi:predicted SnoaL-like aldol condensation-catalyzing enzyme